MQHTIVIKDKNGGIILPAWKVDSATLQIMLFETVFIYDEHMYTTISRETRIVPKTIDSELPIPTHESELHVTLFVDDRGKRNENDTDIKDDF